MARVSAKAAAETRPTPSAEPVAAEPEKTTPPPDEREIVEAPVHVPEGLTTGQKAPLLIMLHSIGTSAEDIEQRTDWVKLAERHAVAWVAPNGPRDALGRRFWDAGPECCNFSRLAVDHVGALRRMIARALERYPIDPERVFIGGISNGGFMAHRFACEAPELVRGVVSISGAGPTDSGACRTPTSLRVLEVHGDADPIVAYAGGHLFNNASLPEHPSVEKTMSDWAARLGCAMKPVSGDPISLERRFPGNETRVARYPGCAHGTLELWTVGGGDHYLAFHEPAPDLIWQYLQQ